mgnify:CR=1 FL=1
MGLKLYNDLIKALVNIADDSDEIIVFQSQIWQMCLKYKIAAKNISRIILNAIEDFSKNKTILFPSFSNDIIKYKKFDMVKSMPNTGLLPCYCLKTKKFKRTFSPLHGFLIKGPRSNEALRLKQFSSWGKNSVFEWLEKKNARWVSINLKWSEGCAFHHRSEEVAKVPYRYYINYYGKLFNNGKYIKNIKEKKYSYSLKVKPKFNFNIWPKIFKKDDTREYLYNEGIKLRSALTKTITKRSVELFRNDPYVSITNKNQVKRWVKLEKTKEVEKQDI